MTMKEALMGNCKLYKGEEKNPFDLDADYFKFQIWNAERSVCENESWWRSLWKEQNKGIRLSVEDQAEELYKLAIYDKLKKMEDPRYDYKAMYFAL